MNDLNTDESGVLLVDFLEQPVLYNKNGFNMFCFSTRNYNHSLYTAFSLSLF